MRLAALLLLSVSVALIAPYAGAVQALHTVGPDQTLGRIAKRYNVSIEALCAANGISRRDRIKPGKKLVVPDRDDKDGSRARHEHPSVEAAPPTERTADPAIPAAGADKPHEAAALPAPSEKPEREPPATPYRNGMQVLEIPGAGPAYYYEPSGPGRRSLRPVLMYLHGRGGRPAEDCQRWAPVARRLGWLLCPSGPGAMGDGRGWNNTWASAHRSALLALKALRERYGRRVQLYGNTIMGFSEGAYAAMNVGVREPRTFNRWLILAGHAKYWGGPGMMALQDVRGSVRRVYLITGVDDEVLEGTLIMRDWLKKSGIATRISTPKDMGHEVLLQRKGGMYRAALTWLEKGSDTESAPPKLASNP